MSTLIYTAHTTLMNQQYITNLKLKIAHLSNENKRLRQELTNKKEFQHPIKPVIEFIAEHTGVTPMEMLGRSRQIDIVTARKVAMYICRKYLNMAWKDTGRMFYRDHSTAIHAYKSVADQLTFSKSIESKIIASWEAVD